MEKIYHNISSLDVIKILNSDSQVGLTEKVQKGDLILEKCFNGRKKYLKFKLFLSQFKSPLMYILIFEA